MLTHRLQRRTAHSPSRGGFTLVELLVVIGIIAILAGVALGPITSGIKKAQQSGGVQTCRTIAISEFQYANDNNQSYPFGASDASDIAKLLINGNYISDATIFYIGGAPGETKFSGTTPGTNIAKTNISYDFFQTSTTAGLNSNTPDQLPVITSCLGTGFTAPTTAGSGTTIGLTTAQPFGTAGAAACFKSNSAKFILSSNSGTAGTLTLLDASFPGCTAVSLQGGG